MEIQVHSKIFGTPTPTSFSFLSQRCLTSKSKELFSWSTKKDVWRSTYNSTHTVFYTGNSYAYGKIFQFYAHVLYVTPYEALMETGKDGKISSVFFFWQHLFSFNHLTFPLSRQWGLLWQMLATNIILQSNLFAPAVKRAYEF